MGFKLNQLYLSKKWGKNQYKVTTFLINDCIYLFVKIKQNNNGK